MSQSHHTAIFTTIFGLIGGLGKAISQKAVLWGISLSGLGSAATYAAVYAAIRLVQMKNVADLMTVRLLNPRIHKADFSGSLPQEIIGLRKSIILALLAKLYFQSDIIFEISRSEISKMMSL